jgi:two-component system OmpR family response regulator
MERVRRGPPVVVLAEDDADTAEIVGEILAPVGYLVRWCPTGRAVLAEVARRPPDLVLLDLVLPDVDGQEVLRALGALPPERRPAVVVLTASPERVTADERTTVSAVVGKPFELDALLGAVAGALRPALGRDAALATPDDPGGS